MSGGHRATDRPTSATWDLMQVTCNSCPAEFDVTGKRPGSVFKCPRCGDGRIRVPDAEDGVEELEALTPEENAPDRGDAPNDAQGDAGETSRTRSVASSRRSPGAAASRAGTRKKAGAAPAGSSRSKRSAARERPTAGGNKLSPAALGAIGVAIVAVAIGGFLMMKDGGSGDDRTTTSGTGTGAGTGASGSGAAANATKSVREIFDERLADLDPTDALSRSSLATFCTEKGMKEEARTLHREALLIEPNLAASRRALGFTLYVGRAQQYKGRWLDATDLAEAIATERFVTGDGLSESSTPTDVFMANSNAIKQQMLSEFPEDKWLYAYGPELMQMPFFVLIERRGKEEDFREEYRENLTALKESFYQRYEKPFGLEDITTPIRAVIFDSTETYNTHRANFPEAGYEEPDSILGYYMPSKQQLVMWRKSQGGNWRGVLFHEGTHMFVHYAFSGADFTPSTQTPWFQEGFAEYFGGYKVEEVGAGRDKKKTYKLGFLLRGRYLEYQGLKLGGLLLTLEQMIKMSPANFIDDRKEQQSDPAARARVSNVYAQGWVIVMYLHYAHGGKYKDAFDQYFTAETKGAGNWSTFADLMDLKTPADWQNLEDDIRKWADSELPKINSVE